MAIVKPGIDQKSATKLVADLQCSHRICVAFYKRFLPMLDEIADELECEFNTWGMIENDTFPQTRTKPSNKWASVFVPLIASNHDYWKVCDDDNAQFGDIYLSFYLYIDSNFTNNENGLDADPVTLSIGNAILKAHLYHPYQLDDDITSFSDLMDEVWETEFEDIELNKKIDITDNIRVIAYEWELSDVIVDPNVVVNKIKSYLESAVPI